MFQRMIDDFKDSTGTALRLTSLAAAAAFALFITTSLPVRGGLCLRAAELRPDRGLPDRRRRVLCRRADRGRQLHGAQEPDQDPRQGGQGERQTNAKPLCRPRLADPMLVATGIQVIRAIGIKKLVPILAIGGLALGFLASREARPASEAPAE